MKVKDWLMFTAFFLCMGLFLLAAVYSMQPVPEQVVNELVAKGLPNNFNDSYNALMFGGYSFLVAGVVCVILAVIPRLNFFN